MKTKQYVSVVYNNIEYKLDYKKLVYILSCLESKKLHDISDDIIYTLLDKYGLLDEIFLQNVNNIW